MPQHDKKWSCASRSACHIHEAEPRAADTSHAGVVMAIGLGQGQACSFPPSPPVCLHASDWLFEDVLSTA